METLTQRTTVIDATSLILGRMSSVVAKRLLKGERIIIVNAEKAVISGKKKNKVREVKEQLSVGHPWKGPFHPRRPDRIVRRTIRGMLPYKQPKGKLAYKRLRVYIGVPEKLQNVEKETLREAHASKLRCPFFTVAELAKEVGWRGEL
jgi:large subunit ribosomal protein L13